MEETLCIFLLISQLSVAVSGTLVVNVAQTFYQAEENHHITLEWTFTPKTLSSSNIYILCELLTDQKVSVLFQLHEGVEVSESQDEQFSGRVQFDKDVLREGRLRLDVSRLRTEDSGLYLCEVNTESGSSSDKCRLSVTVRKDQDNRTNTTIIEPEKPGAEEMDVGAIVGGVLGVLIGLGLILIGVLVKLGIIKNRYREDLNCESWSTLITTLPLVLGINHASCPTEPIQAEEGDDVTLQCHVDHSVNLTKYTLDFTRADLSKKIVHAYRHGKDDADPQMIEYRGRTTLTHADLSRGNMTLLISSRKHVELETRDERQQTCYDGRWTDGCWSENDQKPLWFHQL